MEFAYPLTAIATLLCIAVVFFLAVKVGTARVKYGVTAPAVSGNVDFERYYRAHANTVEFVVLLFPALWLFAVIVSDLYAGIAGLIWAAARLSYAFGYWKDAPKRALGFTISALILTIIVLWTLGVLLF
jgi:glutathione S-transferase